MIDRLGLAALRVPRGEVAHFVPERGRQGRRPGEPLRALLGLLAAWTVLRIVIWEPPFAEPVSERLSREAILPAPVRQVFDQTAAVTSAATPPGRRLRTVRRIPAREWTFYRRPEHNSVALAADADYAMAREAQTGASIRYEAPPHAGPATTPTVPPLLRTGRSAALPRLTGDAWLVLRQGAGGAAIRGPLVGRYGASQAGAVLRYQLSSRGHRPALYVRTGAALDPLADRELALGLSARPVPGLPVRGQLEVRATSNGGQTTASPAVLAVSEVPPVVLPLEFTAETYLAAGYVGGPQATPFVDGNARVERPVAEVAGARLRLGIGAWGGAQEGAAALDVGPTASVRTSLAGQSIALSVDYRHRVAGSAVPRSGLAVSLATAF